MMLDSKKDKKVIKNEEESGKGGIRIVQLLPSLSLGDAIGNETLVINDILKQEGFMTEIYAESIHPKLVDRCKSYIELPNLNPTDVLIYHFAIGSPSMADIIRNTNCRKIMIYHNITPAEFFVPYNKELVAAVNAGRDELKELAGIFDYCIAHSEYSAQEIRNLNVDYPVDVMPLIIPFDDYDKGMNTSVLEKYCEDDCTNILFVGRIVPNKKQEDIIRAFSYYKKNINNKSRLFLVGNPIGMEQYYQRLKDYTQALNVEDVIFTGHIGFDEILAYYNLADVFLCMSEHEGFGVPLVEAMYFDIPIIAYKACAIPYVMAGSGVLTDDKSPKLIAETIDKLSKDPIYREQIILGQRERLQFFSYEKTSETFKYYINKFVKECKNEQ